MSLSEYWSNRRRFKNQKASPFAQTCLDWIKKKKTLLELGCGLGRDTVFFTQNGFEVTAIDIAQAHIDKLKKQYPNITWKGGDIKDIADPDQSFDVVYARLSLHYFDDEQTQRIMQKVYKILKPGGYVCMQCKSTKDPLYGKGEKVGEDMYKNEHIRHFFSREYMAKTLKSFQIEYLEESELKNKEEHSNFIDAIAKKA